VVGGYLGLRRGTLAGSRIGRALYDELLDGLASQGYVNAFAGIALPNEARVALHERCGYEYAGVFPSVGFKFGAWHDVGGGIDD